MFSIAFTLHGWANGGNDSDVFNKEVSGCWWCWWWWWSGGSTGVGLFNRWINGDVIDTDVCLVLNVGLVMIDDVFVGGLNAAGVFVLYNSYSNPPVMKQK